MWPWLIEIPPNPISGICQGHMITLMNWCKNPYFSFYDFTFNATMPNVWKDVSACDNAAIQILVQRLGPHYKLRFSSVWGQFFHRKMSFILSLAKIHFVPCKNLFCPLLKFILSPAKRTFPTSNPLWPSKIASSERLCSWGRDFC